MDNGYRRIQRVSSIRIALSTTPVSTHQLAATRCLHNRQLTDCLRYRFQVLFRNLGIGQSRQVPECTVALPIVAILYTLSIGLQSRNCHQYRAGQLSPLSPYVSHLIAILCTTSWCPDEQSEHRISSRCDHFSLRTAQPTLPPKSDTGNVQCTNGILTCIPICIHLNIYTKAID